MRLLEFWLNNRTEFLIALLRHVALVAAATGIAVSVGVPLGILAYRRPKSGAALLGFANIVQTIPSLAMFGFLIPLPLIGGIGAQAALIVLILYALLPVMRTTVSGLQSIDPAIREAATAMGMTSRQMLRIVELPLARPAIIAGIRVAAVVGVGTATIAAAVGAGGLGDYIFRGVASIDSVVILAGALPAAALALLADFALGWLERRLAPERATAKATGQSLRIIFAVIISAAILLPLLSGLLLARHSARQLVIGSKTFTEQRLLGELMAQIIERNTAIGVERRFGLGDTLVCETALRSGELDLYVEYTGTSLTEIFKQPVSLDSNEVNQTVAARYAATGRVMMPPLGFNNTFAILVRGADARALHLQTISGAAKYTPKWRGGFGHAFLDREDGYRGLVARYQLQFAAPPHAMDLSLTYRALAEGQVDLIVGDATNGLIAKLDLFMLADDRHYFPPYQAVPVIRAETISQYPELWSVFARLHNAVSDQEMQQMNFAADVERKDIPLIISAFLAQRPALTGR